MISSRSLRGTAILAAAVTLAACGSDKAAGPTTANNPQIIADMQAAFEQASGDGDAMRMSLLEYAITSLSIGSPVSSGNVVIDGAKYPFSLTSFSLETQDSEGTSHGGVTIVIGWRHSNGDSVVALIYASDEAAAFMRRTADGGTLQAGGARSLRLADVSRMVRSAKVSSQLSSGSHTLVAMGFVAGDAGWEAGDGVGSALSGSAALSSDTGECDEGGMDGNFEGDNFECSMGRASISATGNLSLYGAEEGDESTRLVSVPSQSVTGVRVLVTQSDPE